MYKSTHFSLISFGFNPLNVVSIGSPDLRRSVLRISLGMTTLPSSSIRLTIPVAFINSPRKNIFTGKVCERKLCLYKKTGICRD